VTLEDMLSCWARDAEAFVRADQRMQAFLEPVIAEAGAIGQKDLARLQELRKVWETLRAELVGDRCRRSCGKCWTVRSDARR
jgi:hypothetical protein